MTSEESGYFADYGKWKKATVEGFISFCQLHCKLQIMTCQFSCSVTAKADNKNILQVQWNKTFKHVDLKLIENENNGKVYVLQPALEAAAHSLPMLMKANMAFFRFPLDWSEAIKNSVR